MTSTKLTGTQLEEMLSTVHRGLQKEHMTRRDFSALEEALTILADEVAARLSDATARMGRTPDLVLADVALRAVRDASCWAKRYRKHAPLRERREQILVALQGAEGAVRLLRRAGELAGP